MKFSLHHRSNFNWDSFQCELRAFTLFTIKRIAMNTHNHAPSTRQMWAFVLSRTCSYFRTYAYSLAIEIEMSLYQQINNQPSSCHQHKWPWWVIPTGHLVQLPLDWLYRYGIPLLEKKSKKRGQWNMFIWYCSYWHAGAQCYTLQQYKM